MTHLLIATSPILSLRVVEDVLASLTRGKRLAKYEGGSKRPIFSHYPNPGIVPLRPRVVLNALESGTGCNCRTMMPSRNRRSSLRGTREMTRRNEARRPTPAG